MRNSAYRVLEHCMLETSFFFCGFDDDLINTTSFTNVIACLDLNVIKIGTAAQVLQEGSIT